MGKEGAKIQLNNSSQVAGEYPSQTGPPNAWASRIPVISLAATSTAHSPPPSPSGTESLFAGEPHLNTTLYRSERMKLVRKYMVMWVTFIIMTSFFSSSF